MPLLPSPLLHGAIQLTAATVILVIKNQKALLPNVQWDIVGSGRLLQRANTLLDSGALISLIRLSVAEDLKLKGRDSDNNHKDVRPRRTQHKELSGPHKIT